MRHTLLSTVLLLLSLALPAPARAQDDRGELGYRVVGFRDRPANCDPYEARYGRCIELVDFAGPDQEGALDSDTLRAVSDLYATMWEGLAYRWNRTGDPIEATIQTDGITRLPGAAQQWQALFPDERSAVSLPEQEAWLSAPEWGLTDEQPVGLFRLLRVSHPPALPAPPRLTLLRGRFAERLGFDDRAHPFDLMFASTNSSGPFFEQMFPFSVAMESDDPTFRPLLHFSISEAAGGDREAALAALAGRPELSLRDELFNEFSRLATNEFELLERVIGVQLARYATRDFTLNQMRVLGALTLMRSPPGDRQRSGLGRTADLVAAALGQTDSTEAVDDAMDRSYLSSERRLRVRYEQLPFEVVEQWIGALETRDPPNAAFFARWSDEARTLTREIQIDQPAPGDLQSLEREAMFSWLRARLRPGLDLEPIVDELRRLGLRLLVARLAPRARDRAETWILLDHVNADITDNLDDTPGVMMTPASLAGLSREQWQTVLAAHGYGAGEIEQRLGSIDPTSVCTTADRLDALEEPVVGAIQMDVLVDATAGLSEPEAVLWENRHRLPFLAVDHPGRTPVELTELVGLPAEPSDDPDDPGRALYRVRWQLWSGWHMLWGVQGINPERSQLSGWSTPICQDMVLTPPDLAPSLVRAALLEGELLPVTPLREGELARVEREREQRDVGADEALAEAQGAAGEAQGQATEAADTVSGAVEGGPTAAADTVSGLLGGLDGAGQGLMIIPVSDRVEYLRSLTREPLRSYASTRPGMLVVVFDGREAKNRPLDNAIPRTPYRRIRRGLGGGQQLEMANWAWWVSTTESPTDFALVAPGYPPQVSVTTDTPIPRWRPVSSIDGHLFAGLSWFPLRHTRTTCAVTAGDQDVVACPDNTSLDSEGIGVDLAALVTFWFSERPRMGIEFGPEFRLDMVYATAPTIPSASTDFDFAWTFKPQGGFTVGLRHAVAPTPLWRRRPSESSGYPWGSDLPDGRTNLGRLHLGVRTGLLLGGAFEGGVEGQLVAELWASGSVRRNEGRRASFTPYRPGLMLGPYARLQVGFPLGENTGALLTLRDSLTFMIGFRAQVRMAQPQLPAGGG